MDLTSGLKLGCLRVVVFLKLPLPLFFSPVSDAGFLPSQFLHLCNFGLHVATLAPLTCFHHYLLAFTLAAKT